jgi:hypothetical protein
MLPLFYPDENAERVCIHKFALQAARTISRGFVNAENLMPYLNLSDSTMLAKYNFMSAHHVRIFRIVLSSHGVSSALPSIMFSMVWAECRLYGIRISGSS